MRISPAQAILHVFLALLFGVFAWFQRNDIDPAIYYKPSGLDATLWFLFYTLIAILFLVSLFRRLPVWLLIASAIACLVEMAVTGPGLAQNLFGDEDFSMTQVSMSAEDPRVELSREFFGAFIAFAGVAFLFLAQRNRKRSEG